MTGNHTHWHTCKKKPYSLSMSKLRWSSSELCITRSELEMRSQLTSASVIDRSGSSCRSERSLLMLYPRGLNACDIHGEIVIYKLMLFV